MLKIPDSIRGKRILVVDDNRTNLTILSGYLKAWGCSCDMALGAEMALSLMHAVVKAGAPYDLVITDMLMPEIDGAELGPAHQIRSRSVAYPDDHAHLAWPARRCGRNEAHRLFRLPDQADTALSAFRLYGDSPWTRTPHAEEERKKRQIVTNYSLSEERRRNVRILLAEDNAINQKLALHLLDRFGFRADAVGDGREALQALASSHYDLVLMDVQMPEMDGFEATRQIREELTEVKNPDVPIIAMTAHAMKGDRTKCLKAGMNDYVSKPIQPDFLLKAIEEQLAECLPVKRSN